MRLAWRSTPSASNFADVFACLGLYSATPKGSFVPGLEFAGVIEAMGPPAARDDSAAMPAGILRSGTRVVGLTRFGGYATALNADARFLRPLRDGWSFEQGAAFPVQALTAWYGLVRLARVHPRLMSCSFTQPQEAWA